MPACQYAGMKSGWQFERERAYNSLVEAIFNGGLEAGVPLSERKLAEMLDVGRTPLREALRELEQEGVIEVRPARGTFIRQFSSIDLVEVYGVRDALECHAAELAARKGAAAGLMICGAQLREMAAYPADFTAAGIDTAGTKFHEEVVKSADSAALTDTLRLLRLKFRLIFHLPRYFDADQIRSTLQDHLAIFDAIVARDATRAAEAMRSHLQRGLALRLLFESEAAAVRAAARNSKPEEETVS